MSGASLIELAIAAVALAVLGLAGWVESSLVSAHRVSIRELVDERRTRAFALLLAETQQLRGAMLVVQLFCMGLATVLIADVTVELDEDYGLVWGVVIGLACGIIAGQVVPRALASHRGPGESSSAARAGRVVAAVFAPLIKPIDLLVGLVRRMLRRRDEHPRLDDPDASEFDAEGGNGQVDDFEHDEQEMISGILQLEEAVAHDLMVPRIDLVAIPHDASIAEAASVAIQAGHSRIPVFGANIDEIVGIVYAKDLLKYVTEEHEDVSLDTILRAAAFVPESKRVDDLLRELQQAKIHMAVVVDEYGGTAGVVTIEDILEEIVGEIEDEYDKAAPRIELTEDGEAIVDGQMLLEDVLEELGVSWVERPSGTISGLLQRQLGRIPRVGEELTVDGVDFKVLGVEKRRIRRVQVAVQDSPDHASVTEPAINGR